MKRNGRKLFFVPRKDLEAREKVCGEMSVQGRRESATPPEMPDARAR
jgi:hypothetical protein